MNPAERQAEESPETLAALDAYLALAQSGRRTECLEFLAKHPELAPMIECLDALENLAPPSGSITTEKDSTAEETRQHLGKYELLEEIGRGGMGVVYKARQKDLDRIVALKIILAGELASPEHVRRFIDEARAAARLQHPNIVRVYDVGEMDGRHFFAMELVAGSTLADLARRGPLEAAEAARLVSVIARAVDYLHSQGIVHRDLKPSNILLDSQCQPYVTDFGLAKLRDAQSQMTQSGVIAGTPSYMSPEQAAGHAAQVGPRSDVFSLGALLYELLTGRPPFRADTPLDTLVQVIESEPTLLRVLNPRVPRELELVCLRCLEKSPEQRYASAAALANDLDRFIAGEAVEAQPPGLWQRLRRWWRRQPALVSRLAGLAICAAIAQANFHLTHNVTVSLHLKVMGTLAVWALVSAMCQWLLKREQWANAVRHVWAGSDVVLLTAVLSIDEALASPLIVCYPVLIAASGLWFRAALVGLTAAMAVFGYGFLVLQDAGWDFPVRQPHWHLMFAVAMGIIGCIVVHQVHRVRALSRFYERRRI